MKYSIYFCSEYILFSKFRDKSPSLSVDDIASPYYFGSDDITKRVANNKETSVIHSGFSS